MIVMLLVLVTALEVDNATAAVRVHDFVMLVVVVVVMLLVLGMVMIELIAVVAVEEASFAVEHGQQNVFTFKK